MHHRYINSNFDSSVSYSDGTVMDSLIANIEPLLWRYKVNAAFWGHNHVYQRQSAVLQKKVVQVSVYIYVCIYGSALSSIPFSVAFRTMHIYIPYTY